MRLACILSLCFAFVWSLALPTNVSAQDKSYTFAQLKEKHLKDRIKAFLADNEDKTAALVRKRWQGSVTFSTNKLVYKDQDTPPTLTWTIQADKQLTGAQELAAKKDMGATIQYVIVTYKKGLLKDQQERAKFFKTVKADFQVVQPGGAKVLVNRVKTLEGQLSALMKRLAQVEAATNKKIVSLETDLKSANKKITGLEGNLKKANLQIMDLDDGLKDANKMIVALGTGLKDAHKKITVLDGNLQVANKKIDKLNGDLITSNTLILDQHKRVKKLEENPTIIRETRFVGLPCYYDPCCGRVIMSSCMGVDMTPHQVTQLEQRLTAQRIEMMKLATKDTDLVRRLASSEFSLSTVRKQVKSVQEDTNRISQKVDQTTAHLNKLDDGLRQALKAKAGLSSLMKDRQTGTSREDLLHRLKKAERHIGTLDTGIRAALSAKSDLNSVMQETVDLFVRDKIALTNRLTSAERSVKQLKNSFGQFIKNNSELVERLEASEKQLQTVRGELQQSRKSNQSLVGRVQSTEKTLGKLDGVLQQVMLGKTNLEQLVQKNLKQSTRDKDDMSQRLVLVERYFQQLKTDLRDVLAARESMQRRLNRTESTLHRLAEISISATGHISGTDTAGRPAQKN